LVFIALIVVGLVVGGYWHYRSEREFFKANHYKEIAAVAEMKSDQVNRWLRERFSDARNVMSGPVVRNAIAEIHRNPGAPGPRAAIRKRLVDMWEGGMYENIYLLATDGRILLSLKEDAEPQNLPINRVVEEAVAGGKPVLRDFYARLNGDVFIDVVAPVMDPGGKPLAVIVLQGNAKEFLYPLIQFRPFPSKTSETLLVRIEGKDVLFLNDLRHRPGTALSLRIPLTQTDLPAVQAVLGRRGMFEGRDYRGVEVLADLRPLPGTPWFMVNKMDASEARQEVRYRVGVVIVVGSLFILLIGATVAYFYRTVREDERKQTEKVLKGQLAFQEGIVEGAAEGICVCHNVPDYPHVSFTVWNSRMKEITGYSMEEINRLGWYQAVYPDPDLQARAIERMDRMRHGDNLKGEEWEITRSDGEKRLVSISTSILQGEKETVHVLALMQDITERKQAVEELRRSENRFATVFRASPVCISLTRLSDGYFLDINDAFLRLFGYDREQVIGRDPLMLNMWAKPDDRARMVGILRERNRIDGFETTFRTKSGEIRNVIVISEVIDVAGEQYILGLTLDITDRKKAEENYQTLFREMLDGFAQHEIICDAKGDPADYRFLAVNPAFGRITGLKVENIVGRTVKEVIPGIERSWIETYGRVALTGEPAYFEDYSADIGKHFLVTAFRPVPNQFACIFSDITDRKNAEAEKEKLQAQLQQAMKMEAVGRLAGGVAHDFNNLLTAIIGNVSLALMKLSPSDPSAGMLVEAKKASERAARLTQQLLAFSRKQIIQPKVLDLNDLIAGMKTMLARLIGENIELRTIPGVGLGRVKVDPGQIEQILINLAVNARDAMPDGGKLLIETANAELDAGYCARHPDASPGRFVMLTVSDTGHGMSYEVRKQIFEPFFTTKPMGSGTGLGLSTIYGAVRQSGGSIHVSSEEGSGTTFRIYLPRVEGEVPKPERDNGPMDLPKGYETVLVVEDEDFVRDVCVTLLERLGYKVLRASNGDEAIALAREHVKRIDLLMTDVVMPGMNGRELAEYMVLLHPETKVLFTSGYTDDAIVHHGVLDEGVAFIGKPYTLSELAKKIRAVLEGP
jgi:PAS domain S-box-containing protein